MNTKFEFLGSPIKDIDHLAKILDVDIDDIFAVSDILNEEMKQKYSIILEKSKMENQQNPMEIGYLKIDKI